MKGNKHPTRFVDVYGKIGVVTVLHTEGCVLSPNHSGGDVHSDNRPSASFSLMDRVDVHACVIRQTCTVHTAWPHYQNWMAIIGLEADPKDC